MKLLKKALFWCVGITAIWLVVCAAAGIMATDWALHPGRRVLTSDAEEQATAIAESDHAILGLAAIQGDDGAVLRAWYIRPTLGNGEVVILLHGQSDNRAGMLGQADMLLRYGYSVLMPDARAQGMSGGDLATYGFLEIGDIQRWINWLVQMQVSHCVYAIGESMGAAQLLNSLKTVHGFCAVAAESSFANFREVS